MRASRPLLWLSALGICVSLSCSTQPAQPEPDADDVQTILDACKSPQEREYAKLALQFAKALAKDDYAAAHALESSHLKADMSVGQLEVAETASREVFGAPLRIFAGGGVNTDPKDLAGPKQRQPGESEFDASARRMSAVRAVGEIPDSVPVDIRKASVELEIERDPRTIPDFESKTGMKPEEVTEEDRIVSYLTVIIVEEDGTLGVAHYFYRWPDIWD